RRDSVRRINMSSEPGNESFFCALRPIPRILSLRRRDYASQVQIGEPSRRKTLSGCSRAPDANRYGARRRCPTAWILLTLTFALPSFKQSEEPWQDSKWRLFAQLFSVSCLPLQ